MFLRLAVDQQTCLLHLLIKSYQKFPDTYNPVFINFDTSIEDFEILFKLVKKGYFIFHIASSEKLQIIKDIDNIVNMENDESFDLEDYKERKNLPSWVTKETLRMAIILAAGDNQSWKESELKAKKLMDQYQSAIENIHIQDII